MAIYDYEELETAVGNYLRRQDSFNVAEHHFFPIGFIGRLCRFGQDLSVVEHRHNPQVKVADYGSDFDIWIDNMAACCTLHAADGGNIRHLKLIDITYMEFSDNGSVTVSITGDGSFPLTGSDGRPIRATCPENLPLELTTHYSHGEPLEDIEGLASLFIRAGQIMNIEINDENRPRFEETVFSHFKFELVPMIPYILEDLETILDQGLVRLAIK